MEPDMRFALEHDIAPGLWKEMWKRHKLLQYTPKELAEYFEFKTKSSCDTKKIHRWILRTEVYSIANPILKKGAIHVNTIVFGKFEQFVIDELTKQMRFSGKGESKIII